MKKYFIALLFGMSLMTMQSVSAATLTLANLFTGSVTTSTGTAVAGQGSGAAATSFGFALPFSVSSWTLDVSNATNVSFNLSGGLSFSTGLFNNSAFMAPSALSFTGPSASALLSAGTYYLSVFSGFGNVGVPYNLNITSTDIVPTGNTPIPAAIWLFGSALMGMIGIGRRKSQPVLAA
jgi:hypothetical protein